MMTNPSASKPGRGRAWPAWREQLGRWWTDYQWPVLGVAWAAALTLGCIGFGRNLAAHGETRRFLDFFYLTLQLIPMNSGAVLPPVSWELQVARFLIPTLTAYTGVKALMLLFRDQFQLARLWVIRDHVVICGLSRKGFLLTKTFTDAPRAGGGDRAGWGEQPAGAMPGARGHRLERRCGRCSVVAQGRARHARGRLSRCATRMASTRRSRCVLRGLPAAAGSCR